METGQRKERTFFEAMNEGYAHYAVLWDSEGVPKDYCFMRVNQVFERVFDLSRDQVVGKTLKDIFGTRISDMEVLFSHVARTGNPASSDWYHPPKKRWFKITVFSHRPGEISVIFIDVTDIRRSNALAIRYRMMLNTSEDIILFIDSQGNIVDFNRKALETYGYEPSVLTGMHVSKLRSPDSIEEFSTQFNQALNNGTIFETVHQKKDGSTFMVEVSSKSAETEAGTVLMSIVRDVTHRKTIEAELKYRAETDELTEIPNRRHFIETYNQLIEKAKAQGEALALHLLDVNRFKCINDTYGHEAGDCVLKVIAQRLQGCCRQNDLAARFGGDEFILVQYPVLDTVDPQALAARIQKAMDGPVHYQGVDIQVSVSIGTSFYPADGAEDGDLIRIADDRMYQQKRQFQQNCSEMQNPEVR